MSFATPSHWQTLFVFTRMSFEHSHRHVGLWLLGLTLPIVLLSMLGYARLLHAPAPLTQIGIAADLPFLPTQLGLDQTVFQIQPEVSKPGELVRRADLRIGIERATDGAIVVHSSASDQPLGLLIKQRVELSEPGWTVRQEIARDDQRALQYLPSILVISLLNIGLLLAGAKLSRERSTHSLRIFQVLPLPFWTYVLAEWITKLVLGSMATILALLAASLLMGAELSLRQLTLVLMVSALISTAFIGLGVAVACLVQDHGRALGIFVAVNLLLAVFGDLFFASEKYLITELVALVLPSSYGADLLRGLILDQGFQLAPTLSILYLLVFSALMFGFAARKLGRRAGA